MFGGGFRKGEQQELVSYFPLSVLFLCASVFRFSDRTQLCKTKQRREAPPDKDQPRLRNAVVARRQ